MSKILLVEDDSQTRHLLKEVFTRKGYNIVEAIDGEDAVSVFKKLQEKPDLIILDFRLPKRNGLEVSKEILAINPLSKILIVTGDPKINLSELLAYGICYKRKPVDMIDLLKEIKKIIKK
ncbi:MAG: response regulator [Candidatus Heimdallarchaeota archaeon]|nr:response regulator [Candidatus Heimdallarchaeota archaeon]